MKTLMLLMALACASLQVNAQTTEKNKVSESYAGKSDKKPLLECEDSFTKWLGKVERNTNSLVQPFQPLNELLIPINKISKDLSPTIKLIALNPKNNE
ncbi:MAG: hypothetical protein MUF68_04540 [Cyclobacteriaceae bacterium]|jgi:hypothetical protein|nr:hypothetical protein [Cyclobacteriaceae bacterium]